MTYERKKSGSGRSATQTPVRRGRYVAPSPDPSIAHGRNHLSCGVVRLNREYHGARARLPPPLRAARARAPRNPIVSGNHRADTRVPVARSPNRPDLLTPHSFRLIHQGVAQGNVGLAFGLVIFAGLTTTIGSAFVYCTSYANTKALAAALGASAGVMLTSPSSRSSPLRPSRGSRLPTRSTAPSWRCCASSAASWQPSASTGGWCIRLARRSNSGRVRTTRRTRCACALGSERRHRHALRRARDVVRRGGGDARRHPGGGWHQGDHAKGRLGANHPFGRASEAPMPEGTLNGHSKERRATAILRTCCPTR